jgi:hypothetical protein
MHALLELKLILPLGTLLIALTTSYVRIVNEMTKMYINDMKYNNYNNNFVDKRVVFEDVY